MIEKDKKSTNIIKENGQPKINTLPELKDSKLIKVVTKPVNNINVVSDSDLITLPIKCNGKELTAIIDTGSQVTLVDSQLAEKNNWEPTFNNGTLTDAQGNLIPTTGAFMAEVEIVLDNISKTATLPIVIAERLPASFILGIDITSALNLCLDLGNKRAFYLKDKQKTGVSLVNSCSIRPRTQQILKAYTSQVGTILCLPFNEVGKGIMVGNSISEVKNNLVETLIYNPTNEFISLKAGTQIATYEPIIEHKVNNIASSKQVIEGELKFCVATNLPEDKQYELCKLVRDNKKAFAVGGIGTTDLIEHVIELKPGATPHQEPLRRRPHADTEECKKQVQEMLSQGYIEESSSPWAAAYVLVKKKNGQKRLCIASRRLNEQTKKFAYPLPNIDDCIETLSGKKYFSLLDMASGFWQIKMENNSKEYTTFRTEEGLFQFKRMPFGLTNAPASFQKMVNAVYSGLKGLNLQVFIDDLCVASDSWEDHLNTLEQVFQATIRAGLTLQGEKCLLGASEVTFLGHQISENGIKQDPNKLKALESLKTPSNKDEVKQFLGLSGYYRKFVPSFAHIAAPLTELTRQKVSFTWTSKEELAFRTIIDELKKNATLVHFNHYDPILLKTDASKNAIAGILLQHQNGDWKIVTCVSRRLTRKVPSPITRLSGNEVAGR